MSENSSGPRHSAGLTEKGVAVYYDRFDPAGPAKPETVIMIHGGGHSGACYLRTLDGRPGWAYTFAKAGYRVLVPDWPGYGRSGYIPMLEHTVESVVEGLGRLLDEQTEPVVLMTHSMSGAHGWKLLETHGDKIARVVGVAPSPPGNVLPEAEILSETDDFVELVAGPMSYRLSKRDVLVPDRAFVEKKLVGDGRFFPRDKIEAYMGSLLALPPRIISQRVNLHGTQIRVQDPSRLAGSRILVILGTNDVDHSFDFDKTTADWLSAAGAKTDFIYLGDRGIEGNGHMLMMEQNSDEIAGVILDWLSRP